jgi:hypothetical protein
MDIVESPKRSVWPFLGGLLLGLVIAIVGIYSFRKPAASSADFVAADVTSFTQKLVLVGVKADGTEVPTGLQVASSGVAESWIHPIIAVSPDNTKAAYAFWADGKMRVHLADVDGSDDIAIVDQVVSSGTGEFLKESFGWGLDGKALYWQERQGVCGANGKLIAGVPQPNDCSRQQYVMYRYDLAKGEKTIVDKRIQ